MPTERPIETSPEPELTGATPRAVRFRPRALLGIAALASLWAIVLGLLACAWRHEYNNWNALLQHGTPAVATVYDKQTFGGRSTNYYVEFRFPSDAGPVEDSVTVSAPSYYRTHLGDTFPITYVPHTSGKVWQTGQITTARRDQEAVVFLAMAGTFSVAFAGTLLYLTLIVQRQRWFLQRGSVATGQITENWTTGGKYPTWNLRYEYTVEQTTYPATTSVNEKVYQAQMDRPDRAVTVLYDPARPARNMPRFKITAADLI